MFLDIFSIPSRVVKNDIGYMYVHHTGSTSNIDHCVFSVSLMSSVVHFDEDYCNIDYLHISLTFSLPSVPHAKAPKKKNGSKNQIGKRQIITLI